MCQEQIDVWKALNTRFTRVWYVAARTSEE